MCSGPNMIAFIETSEKGFALWSLANGKEPYESQG
jgi:hypothetical protein